MHTHVALMLCRRTAAALLAAAAFGGCMMHSPEGVAYSTRDATNVGATGGAAGGSVSGSGGLQTGGSPKEQRGNTRPGIDRDGHGPAAGAILDPTGAATRGRPY